MLRLLHLLLSHLMFAGTMFFAAGADALGGGDPGAGADPGASSGDLGGDPAGNDPSLNADPSSDPNSLDDPNADPDAPIDLGDGRTVPGKWKSLIDHAKTQGMDKEVKQLFFGQQKLMGKFPGGVNDAIKLAEAVEQFGGLDAVNELKGELDGYHQDAELLRTNPQEWIKSSFEQDADASLKAFSHSLDYVADNFPEQYDHIGAKIVFNTIQDSAVVDAYHLLAGMKDNPQAQEMAKKIAGMYNDIKNLAQKVPEKKIDPQIKALDEKKAALDKQELQQRHNQVNAQVFPKLQTGIRSTLDKEAKAVGFDIKKFESEQPGAYKAMVLEIVNRVMQKAQSDGTFVKNHVAVMKSGDTKRAAAMIDKKHDAITKDIVLAVAKEYGIVKKATSRPGGNNNGNRNNNSDGTMLRVSQKPPAHEIDWNKTGNKIYDAQAVLKNGKTVTWA